MIARERAHLQFATRNRRPPRDPLNPALSYLYAVLHGRCVAAAVGAGLDPKAGFLHARRAGRAALALDLMEPFGPLVMDAALIAAFNNGEFPPEAFEQTDGACRQTALGRRSALRALERRLGQSVSDATCATAHTYRAAITAQARTLARALRHGNPFAAFQPRR